MIDYGEFFGILAALLAVFIYLPQLIHILKTKKTRDISLLFLILILLCNISWALNGYWNRNNTKIKDFRYFEVGNKDYVEISEENNQKEEIPQPNINIGSDKFFSNEFESE